MSLNARAPPVGERPRWLVRSSSFNANASSFHSKQGEEVEGEDSQGSSHSSEVSEEEDLLHDYASSAARPADAAPPTPHEGQEDESSVAFLRKELISARAFFSRRLLESASRASKAEAEVRALRAALARRVAAPLPEETPAALEEAEREREKQHREKLLEMRRFYQKKIEELTKKYEVRLGQSLRAGSGAEAGGMGLLEASRLRAENQALRTRVEELEPGLSTNAGSGSLETIRLRSQVGEVERLRAALAAARQEADRLVRLNAGLTSRLSTTQRRLAAIPDNPGTREYAELLSKLEAVEERTQARERRVARAFQARDEDARLALERERGEFKRIVEEKNQELLAFRRELEDIRAGFARFGIAAKARPTLPATRRAGR